jgi:hypothetical protein
MPSSNFKLFDENKQNMLTSQEYDSSSQRLNGVQAGVASSQLQNKSMYQTSLIAYALAQIMVANGIDASDEEAVSTFVSNLRSGIAKSALDECFGKDNSLSSATAQKFVDNDVSSVAPSNPSEAFDDIVSKKIFVTEIITQSQKWVAHRVAGEVQGLAFGAGGGGGCRVQSSSGGGGGGGGAMTQFSFTPNEGDSYDVIIGVGGAAATGFYNDKGKAGGSTSFGNLATAAGGSGGNGLTGGSGGSGGGAAAGGSGGNGSYGGGGGSWIVNVAGASGGTYGGGGGNKSANGTGGNGGTYGGNGGNNSTSATNGTDTTSLDLDFTGPGTGGGICGGGGGYGGKGGSSGSASGGGGGYGGNGGNGGAGNPPGCGGGGGYGGNGGNGGSAATNQYPNAGGGGGGGYGKNGNGGEGGSSYGNQKGGIGQKGGFAAGGGGGGYGNIGGDGGDGIVILKYWKYEI